MAGARGKGRPPGLTERGLLDWLGRADPLVERQGPAKDESVPALGKALLQDSFVWDHQTLFFQPNYGAWDREKSLEALLCAEESPNRDQGTCVFRMYFNPCSHCALKAQLEGQVLPCPSSFPSSMDSTPLILCPFPGPLIVVSNSDRGNAFLLFLERCQAA